MMSGWSSGLWRLQVALFSTLASQAVRAGGATGHNIVNALKTSEAAQPPNNSTRSGRGGGDCKSNVRVKMWVFFSLVHKVWLAELLWNRTAHHTSQWRLPHCFTWSMRASFITSPSVAATIAFRNFRTHMLVSPSFSRRHSSPHFLLYSWQPHCVHSDPLCEFRRGARRRVGAPLGRLPLFASCLCEVGGFHAWLHANLYIPLS